MSLDFRKKGDSYIPFFNNGKTKSSLDLDSTLKLASDLEVGEILVNSIDKDGLMSGFDLELLSTVSKIAKCPVIACGGCDKLEDFTLAVDNGADAVAAGSIFHWKGESIITIKDYMKERNYNIREI